MSYNGVPTGPITLKKLGPMDYTSLQSSSSGGTSPTSLTRTISQSVRKLPLVSSTSSRDVSRSQSRERSHKRSDITTSANENATIEEHSTSLVKKLRKKTKGAGGGKDSTEEEDDVTNERLFEMLDQTNASIGSLNEVITKCHIAIERLQSSHTPDIHVEEIEIDESSDEGFLAYYCCCFSRDTM